MEDTLIASYVTLIIGYLIKDNKVSLARSCTDKLIHVFFFQEHEAQVRQLLPDSNFSKMTAVLKKFYNFMNLTASVS